MALLLRLRLLDGSRRDLAVERGWFVDPGQIRIDEELDATEWFAVSGLVDAHGHLSAGSVEEMVAAGAGPSLERLRSHAAAQLAGGVLSVLDKGSWSEESRAILADPPTDRPELEMAGAMISVPGGYYEGFGTVIEPEDIRETVAAAAAATPATWVKLVGDWPRKGRGAVANFDAEQLQMAAEAAHRAGRQVAVHTMAPQVPSDAVRAGVDSIEHGLFLTESDLGELGSRSGSWVPTVVAMEGTRDDLRPGSTGANLIREGLDNVARLLPMAADAGVTVLTGTDLVLPHGRVAFEAARLVDYGLPVPAAIDAVTGGAGTAHDPARRLAPGEAADVVCVAASPLEDITALQDPIVVMRAGRFVVRP